MRKAIGLLVAPLLMLLVLAGCAPEGLDPSTLTPALAEKYVGARAREAIAAIKANDTAKLAEMAHPEKGIRFAPYAHFGAGEQTFLPAQIRGLSGDNTVYGWGIFDGSGAPIQLTYADYYKRFIYSKDFAAAPQVEWNRWQSRGNMIDNTHETYPKGVSVEYHFPGQDPQYGGMDWQSLRLIFELKGKTWYLVAIIHDQWTI